ncbi:twin-arginine translocation signal domain-containing protein [Pseudonocardia sp.]|uniref:twin-arginine translocation signal domain-containing protein n=1 Tax=Pseudonocardia sp. TaxID=60912 RepID=UPI0039C99921
MTEHRPHDNDAAPSSRRALIKRLTVGAAAGAAGAAFVYPVIHTFSQEWADAAVGQRVDYSTASTNATTAQALPVVDLLS